MARKEWKDNNKKEKDKEGTGGKRGMKQDK